MMLKHFINHNKGDCHLPAWDSREAFRKAARIGAICNVIENLFQRKRYSVQVATGD